MQFSFRKPHFWHPQNFAKTLFWHSVTLFAFSKIPKNTTKMGNTVKKLGPVFNTRLGPVFNARSSKLVQFFAVFPSCIVFLAFFETHIVSQCVKIVFLQNFGFIKMRFSNRKLHFLFLSFLCWRERERNRKRKKQRKGEKPKKPYKNRVF